MSNTEDTAVPAKYIPAKHRNNGPPPDPRTTVETGLLHFDTLTAECAVLKKELAAAQTKITELTTELETHDRNYATVESRVQTALIQRDQAVTAAGELRGILRGIGDMVARYETEKD